MQKITWFDYAAIFCQLLIIIIIIITKPRLGKMSIYADLVGRARVCVCGGPKPTQTTTCLS